MSNTGPPAGGPPPPTSLAFQIAAPVIAGTMLLIGVYAILQAPTEPAPAIRAGADAPVRRAPSQGVDATLDPTGTSNSNSNANANAHEPEPEQAPLPLDVEHAHQTKYDELLDLRFVRSGGGHGGELRSLRQLVRRDRITLVNVWATWCEPCKREFEFFRSLLADRELEVQFVPIQLGDQPLSAEIAELLPPAKVTLIDHVAEGSVQRTLSTLGLVTDERSRVPISLVFDCLGRLRWLHLEEIRDFSLVSREVERLAREMRRGICHTRIDPPTPSADPCGDGTCRVATGEDCHSCPADCLCPVGDRCVPQGRGGRHICSAEVLFVPK